MRILALDISKRGTGMAVGDGSRPPHTALLRFPGIYFGQTGASYSRWLNDQIAVDRPDLIAYEAALITGAAGAAETRYTLIGLAMLTETIAELRGIRLVRANIQTWRKLFLGTGRPKDPKTAALAMCAGLCWDVQGDHNRAEACGVWAWAHHEHGNRRAVRDLLSRMTMRQLEASA